MTHSPLFPWWSLFLELTASGKKTKGGVYSTPPLILREAGNHIVRSYYPSRLLLPLWQNLCMLSAVSLSCIDKVCTWGQSNPCMPSFPFSWSLSPLSQVKNRYLVSCPSLPGFNRCTHRVQPGFASFLCESLSVFGSCLSHGCRLLSLLLRFIILLDRPDGNGWSCFSLSSSPGCLSEGWIRFFGWWLSWSLCLLSLSFGPKIISKTIFNNQGNDEYEMRKGSLSGSGYLMLGVRFCLMDSWSGL